SSLTATFLHVARSPERSLSNRGRDKYAFVVRKASPRGCSRFDPNLRLKRIARAHCRLAYRVPKQPRPSNLAVPRENNSDARKSEEHTSELQSRGHLVCRLLLEKKKRNKTMIIHILEIQIKNN